MAQPRMFILSLAAALTFGINGQTVTPVDHEKPLSTSDIVIAADDAVPSANQSSQGKPAAIETDVAAAHD